MSYVEEGRLNCYWYGMYWIKSVICFGRGGCKAKLYGLYWVGVIVGVIYEYVSESDVVDVRLSYMGCTVWV